MEGVFVMPAKITKFEDGIEYKLCQKCKRYLPKTAEYFF